jgi:hypothetical protein
MLGAIQQDDDAGIELHASTLQKCEPADVIDGLVSVADWIRAKAPELAESVLLKHLHAMTRDTTPSKHEALLELGTCALITGDGPRLNSALVRQAQGRRMTGDDRGDNVLRLLFAAGRAAKELGTPNLRRQGQGAGVPSPNGIGTAWPRQGEGAPAQAVGHDSEGGTHQRHSAVGVVGVAWSLVAKIGTALLIALVVAGYLYGGTNNAHMRCLQHRFGEPGVLGSIACAVQH